MSGAASFRFQAADSFFHRLDPISKLVWVFGVSLLAFGAYVAWLQVALASGVLATALLLARIPVRVVWRGTWLFALACASFCLIQTLTLPGHRTLFRVLGHPVHADSADYALASALRIYTIILSSLVFVRSSDPRELAIGLVTEARVPYRVAYALFIALRIVPTIEEEIRTIRAAQAVRGVGRARGLGGRLAETRRYAIPLLVGSLRRASTMVMSMEARAFGAYPQRSFIERPRIRLSGATVCTVMLLLVAAWYAALGFGYVHTVSVASAT